MNRNLVSGILLSVMACWALTLLSLAITLPAASVPEGILAYTGFAGKNPLVDFIRYALITVGTIGAYFFGSSQSEKCLSFLNTLWNQSFVRFVVYFGFIALSFVAFSGKDLKAPLDTFHLGERVGFLPLLENGKSLFRDAFMIHGIGYDVVFSWFAQKWAWKDNVLGLTQFIDVAIVYLVTIFAALNLAIASGSKDDQNSFWMRLGTAALALIFLNRVGFLYLFSKDVVLMFQVLLLFLWKHASSKHSLSLSLVFAALLGVTIPYSYLYTFDRALFGTVFVGVMSLLLFWTMDKRVRYLSFFSFLISSVSTLFVINQVFGQQNLAYLGEMIHYWIRYGKHIWFTELWNLFLFYPVLMLFCAAQILLLIYFVQQFLNSGDKRQFFSRHFYTLCFFLLSGLFLQTLLNRSDSGHMKAGMWPLLFCLIAMGLPFLIKFFQDIERRVKDGFFEPKRFCFYLVIFHIGFFVGPFEGIKDTYYYLQRAQSTDAQIIKSSYREAVESLKDEVGEASCFYTLTSEGIWYYLFNKPSCSRYHQLLYARTQTARTELLENLKQTSPDVILYSNDLWSNHLDGISIEESHPELIAYVKQAYKPYRRVGPHAFWKLK